MSVLDRFSLKDRIALVTAGAGPQFGSSISNALAKAAPRSSPRPDHSIPISKFAQMLQQRGFEAFGMALDVGNPKSISELRDEVLARFGRLDVLVNNARAVIEGGFDVQDPDDWIDAPKGTWRGCSR